MRLHAHQTASTDPRTRGSALGAEFAAPIRRVSELYAAHFEAMGIPSPRAAEVAERSHRALELWAPHLAAEVEATAAGAGLELHEVARLNARTEIMALVPPTPEGECSTLVRIPREGAPETLQTWDWHAHLAPEGLLLAGQGATGLRYKLFTEFGVLGKIGLNEAGLGVHFNILNHASDGAGDGVPVHAVARRVIEEAHDVEEAVEIASSAAVSASTVLTVAQRGRAVSIELSPAGTALVRPDEQGWILHTNHFLDPRLAEGDTIPKVESTTEIRRDFLDERRERLGGLTPDRRCAAVAEEGASPVIMCSDPSLPATQRWDSLLTVALDVEGFAFLHHAGTPREAAVHGLRPF